jgi:hypothetical protein
MSPERIGKISSVLARVQEITTEMRWKASSRRIDYQHTAALVFVNDLGDQFRINKGAMVASDRDLANQIWGPVASGKEDHLACANEKGDHLLSNQTETGSNGSNGVAQTVPESFLSPTVQRLSRCPAACPTSAAARHRVPDSRCGLPILRHAKSRPRRRRGSRVRARSSWP